MHARSNVHAVAEITVVHHGPGGRHRQKQGRACLGEVGGVEEEQRPLAPAGVLHADDQDACVRARVSVRGVGARARLCVRVRRCGWACALGV